MAIKREKPSTKARREGYAHLHNLRRILMKLLYPTVYVGKFPNEEVGLDLEFTKEGWRDYMVRHIPEEHRGGKDSLPPSKSKRRKQKRKDRKVTTHES